MTLPPMPGRRKPTSGALQDSMQLGFSIGSRGYIGTGGDFSFYKISGNMTLPPMPGRRKPTSGALQDSMQSGFPSAAKGISVLGDFSFPYQ